MRQINSGLATIRTYANFRIADNTRNVPPVRYLRVRLALFHSSKYNLAGGDERDAMAIALRHAAPRRPPGGR
jgi:hypothetical protein